MGGKNQDKAGGTLFIYLLPLLPQSFFDSTRLVQNVQRCTYKDVL